MKKIKLPIILFYVASTAVLSNLKRIEVTYQPTTVADSWQQLKKKKGLYLKLT